MELEPKKIKLPDDLGNDLLADVSISNYMQDATKKLLEDIQKKREELIYKHLEILGVSIDIEQEQRRRFKSLSIEFKDDEETIYYNDGSENGLRVITFVTKQQPFDPEKLTIGYDTHYY